MQPEETVSVQDSEPCKEPLCNFQIYYGVFFVSVFVFVLEGVEWEENFHQILSIPQALPPQHFFLKCVKKDGEEEWIYVCTSEKHLILLCNWTIIIKGTCRERCYDLMFTHVCCLPHFLGKGYIALCTEG